MALAKYNVTGRDISIKIRILQAIARYYKAKAPRTKKSKDKLIETNIKIASLKMLRNRVGLINSLKS